MQRGEYLRLEKRQVLIILYRQKMQFSYANKLITFCCVQVLECSRPHKKAKSTRGTERSIPGDATDKATSTRNKTSSASKATPRNKKRASTSK